MRINLYRGTLTSTIYALLVSVLIGCGGGGGGGQGSDDGSTAAIALGSGPPYSITLELEPGNTGRAVVGPDGGTVETTDANGARFTLTIPPGALSRDQEIVLRPVSGAPNLPLAGGLVAGVQFEPDGLILGVPATLDIVFPAGSSPVIPTVFGWAGTGQHFHLKPAFAADHMVSLMVPHFSGAGVGDGDPAPAIEAARGDNLLEVIFSSQLAGRLQELREEICTDVVEVVDPDTLEVVERIVTTDCSRDEEVEVFARLAEDGQALELVFVWVQAVQRLAEISKETTSSLDAAVTSWIALGAYLDGLCIATGNLPGCFADFEGMQDSNSYVRRMLVEGYIAEFERRYQACDDAGLLDRLSEMGLLGLDDLLEPQHGLAQGDVFQRYGCQLLIEVSGFPAQIANGGPSVEKVSFDVALSTLVGGPLASVRVGVRVPEGSCAVVDASSASDPDLKTGPGGHLSNLSLSAVNCSSFQRAAVEIFVDANRDPVQPDVVFAPKRLAVSAQITGNTPSFTLLPQNAVIGIGQQLLFTASATDVENPTFVWEATGGTISEGGLYTAGARPGSFLVGATLVETGETILTSVTVQGVAVYVAPELIALGRGESHQFEAAAVGLESPEVVWSAEGGVIDQNGLFTAGNNMGDFTVMASSSANEGVAGLAATRIRDNFVRCGVARARDTGRQDDRDGVFIRFDGQACTLTPACLSGDENICGESEFGGDVLMLLDVGNADPQLVNWDVERLGDTNWSVAPDYRSGNGSGRFFATATRSQGPGAGRSYVLDMKIDLTADGTKAEMTLDALITPLE